MQLLNDDDRHHHRQAIKACSDQTKIASTITLSIVFPSSFFFSFFCFFCFSFRLLLSLKFCLIETEELTG